MKSLMDSIIQNGVSFGCLGADTANAIERQMTCADQLAALYQVHLIGRENSGQWLQAAPTATT